MTEKKIFFIDAYALVFRSYYAFIHRPLINAKGFNTSILHGFLTTLLSLIEQEKPSHLIIVFDDDKPSFRKTVYEAYKANRGETPEDIKLSVPILKELLKALDFSFLQMADYEADDVIGALSKKSTEIGFLSYMVTPDKDYLQLLEPNNNIYKIISKSSKPEIITIDDFKEKYQLSDPKLFIDILALWGDSADNIPGAKGIGEKSAFALVQKYGTIENIYANIDSVDKKYQNKLIESKENVFLSKQLATIVTDIDLNINFDTFLLPPKINITKALPLLQEYELTNIIKKLGGNTSSKPTPKKIRSENSDQLSFFNDDTEEQTDTPETNLDTIQTIKPNYHLIDTIDSLESLAKKLENSSHFSFDTETTSLEAMLADPVGISFAFTPHEAYYIPLNDNSLKEHFIVRFQPLFKSKKQLKIAHNIKYDMHILAHMGIEPSPPYYDTLLAHYLLNPDGKHSLDFLAKTLLNYQTIPISSLIGEKGKNQKNIGSLPPAMVKDYAAEDADIALQLYQHIAPQIANEPKLNELLQNIELPLTKVLLQMERHGITIDTRRLSEIETQLTTLLKETETEIFKLSGEPFNIASPQQLGHILFDKLKIIQKNIKRTKTKQYSTSEETLSKLLDTHPIVSLILKYRTLNKLLNTYISSLPKQINPKTDKIHASFNQMVVNTGRLSSANPNLQNIPIRDKLGKQIRTAFIPEMPSAWFVSSDYSQIELRIMAHFSKDQHMLEAFQRNEDIHKATAAKIFGVAPEAVTPEQRSKAKTANFGIIYGISAFGLSQQLNISRKEAQTLIDDYFANFPSIKDYINRSIETARKKGYVETLFGRRKYLPDINSNNHVVRNFAERNAINMPIQGTSADIIKIAMINILRKLEEGHFKASLIIQVHDELCFDVPNTELGLVKDLVKEEMEKAVSLDVPLKADVGFGKNWLEAH